MRTLNRCVMHLHKEGIKVVLDGVFNHVGQRILGVSGCVEEPGNSPLYKTGLPGLILAEIPIIMTASGMKAGKATMIWSN